MDDNTSKNNESTIELSEPDRRDGTGTSDDAGVQTSSDFADSMTLEESASSDLSTLENGEVTGGNAVPESASVKATAETHPPVAFQKYQELFDAREKLYDRFLRKQAEFENLRKRTEKEKQEFYDFALSSFIKELLPVLDGLDRGLFAHEGETVESCKKGMELILKQLRDVLASAGLQPIRAIGTIFDPNYHQAVVSEENGNLAENEIIEELQRGYTFKDRLLRPSMVKVAVPPAAPAKTEDSREQEPNLEGS